MVLGQFRCHFLISSVKNHASVNFQDERFFETEVIEEEVVFKMSVEAHQVVISKHESYRYKLPLKKLS